ncbi:hypothetical protein HYU40_03295 [Candidatus Woesearchaeota archaeon]|nr:hypothetical protein [Candidatus Woesearchaeota archaeon]
MKAMAMDKKTFSTIAGVVFAVIAVLHLLRAILGWQAVIGSFEVPMWLSWVAAVVAAYLAYSALRPV